MIMIAEKDGDLFDNRFQSDLMIGTPRTIVKDLNIHVFLRVSNPKKGIFSLGPVCH